MKNKFLITCCAFSLATLPLLGSCDKNIKEIAAPPGKTDFFFFGQTTSKITFLSTQMNPVEEAGKMRNTIWGDYNKLFMLTFSGIVLEGKPIASVLDASAIELQRILDEQNVRCWLPDVSKKRPCRIE